MKPFSMAMLCEFTAVFKKFYKTNKILSTIADGILLD